LIRAVHDSSSRIGLRELTQLFILNLVVAFCFAILTGVVNTAPLTVGSFSVSDVRYPHSVRVPFAVRYCGCNCCKPVPVAAPSKTYVYGRSPAEIVRSNPVGDMDVFLF
jgi:hypothetical protein